MFRSLLIVFLLTLFTSTSVAAAEKSPRVEVRVWATIGQQLLTLYGYSSPRTIVKLEGRQVIEETQSDNSGYFEFKEILLPPHNLKNLELCITAYDQRSTSFPTCLPSLPTGPYDFSVGPVLLPPIIRLDNDTARGLTYPAAEVDIHFANDYPSQAFMGTKQVLAYGLPVYRIKSDEDGYFEFTLPSGRPGRWRLFAGSFYQDSPSPKSNTLVFDLLSQPAAIKNDLSTVLMKLLNLIKPFWWALIICLEAAILAYLLLDRKLAKDYPHPLGNHLVVDATLEEVFTGNAR